jgi:peptidoglycan hydrolase CwlO-like protein
VFIALVKGIKPLNFTEIRISPVVLLFALFLSCSGGAEQSQEQESVSEEVKKQTEMIEQSIQSLDESLEKAESDLKQAESEIDSLLNDI